MQYVMGIDPCRRFTFGLTIECSEVRVWYGSRSLFVATDALDMTKVSNCNSDCILELIVASLGQRQASSNASLPLLRFCIERGYGMGPDNDTLQ